MHATPFKTPRPLRTPKRRDLNHEMGGSDSDESIASTNSDQAPSSSSGGELSLRAEFDEFVRCHEIFVQHKEHVEDHYIGFLEQFKVFLAEHEKVENECVRLKTCLDEKIEENNDLAFKLQKARKLFDVEKTTTRRIIRERDDLRRQILCARELLFKSPKHTPEELYAKLSFLNNGTEREIHEQPPHLSGIKEINSTGSMLSDFSYSRSDDDLDNSIVGGGKSWKKHRSSTIGLPEPVPKKRRSSGVGVTHVDIGTVDTVRATTTVTVPKVGPITATSVIESVPQAVQDDLPMAIPSNLVLEAWARDSPTKRPERLVTQKQHNFMQKILVIPYVCVGCNKRIRFGRSALKCKECKTVCHHECKDLIPLPCIPTVNTPNRNILGSIGDFTSTTPPMVPPLILYCVNEIELRGFSEVGLYRVPGSEREVKTLKERFLKGRGAPCLNQIDIHVLCGTVKDFLRSLKEPLVTYALWGNFVKACELPDDERVQCLYKIIGELPQPNRDTLAYVIRHLQRVSLAIDCKMTISNLSKVFGPTIVGYSSEDPNPENLLDEMLKHNCVMEHLLNIPSEYWAVFTDVESKSTKLQQTPSTDSLLQGSVFGTPQRRRPRKQGNYFPSPKC